MAELETRVKTLEEDLYNTNVLLKQGADIALVRDRDTRAAIADLEGSVNELQGRRRGREAAAVARGRLPRAGSRNIPAHRREPDNEAEG